MSASLLRLLGDVSIRVTLLALVVGALVRVLGIRAPRAEHRAWCAVLAAMLTMPVLQRVLPPVPIVLPSPSAESTAVVHEAAPPFDVSAERSSSSAGRRPRTFASDGATSGVLSASIRSGNGVAPDLQPDRPQAWLSWSSVSAIAAALYLAGVLWQFLRLLAGWFGVRRIRRMSQRITTIDGPPFVLESTQTCVPAVLGILRPVILLPISWRTWSDSALRLVLGHETAHIRHFDPLVTFVSRLSRAVFWFHPLAWWLDRKLLSLAEQACDDESLAGGGDARAYASMLVDVARSMSDRGRRVSWQLVGMAGSGFVGERIQRVLGGLAPQAVPRWRAALAAVSIVAAVAVTAACRRSTVVSAYELTPAQEQHERELGADLQRLEEPFARFVTPLQDADVVSLVRQADAQPDNLERLDDLLVVYLYRLSAVPGHGSDGRVYWVPTRRPEVPRLSRTEADAMVADRRRRILWLIEHHPEAPIAGTIQARLLPHAAATGLAADDEGYELARQAWLKQANLPNAASAVLDHAASFFEWSDRQTAERLLLRAQALEPARRWWSVRLGLLYASAVTQYDFMGRASPPMRDAQREQRADEIARSPYAQVVRAKLGSSNDPALLISAARGFSYAARGSGDIRQAWAAQCYQRALRFDPQSVLAHQALLWLRGQGAFSNGLGALWRTPPDRAYAEVLALPEAEQLPRLAQFTRQKAAGLESMDRYHDANLDALADLERHDAEQSARAALTLAARRGDDPDYGTAIYFANLTLGTLAFRDGDRAGAIRYLEAASKAPVSEELAYGDVVFGCCGYPSLPRKLLAAGERDAVAAFFERMARINLAARAELRDRAAAIRRGESPRL